jgi:hypothetical protein
MWELVKLVETFSVRSPLDSVYALNIYQQLYHPVLEMEPSSIIFNIDKLRRHIG